VFSKIVKNKDDPRPLYVLVYNQLLDKIESGELAEGSMLPPESKLSQLLGVSRATLRQALLILKEDGFITNLQGSGTYISKNISRIGLGLENLVSIPEMLGGGEIEVRQLTLNLEHPDSVLKNVLKLEDHELLVVLERVYARDDDLLAYAITFIPNTRLLVPVTLNSAQSVLDYTHNELVEGSEMAVSKINATVTGGFIAECLDLDKGEVLLLLEDCLIDSEGLPLALTKLYFRTDMVNFTINRRKHYRRGQGHEEDPAGYRSGH
jgi:GntR family transcriptional regulator